MHSRYFVKIAKDEAENSEEARSKAYSTLEEQGFAAQGGYFSSAPSDWYVVGGRWSGTLAQALKPKEYQAFIENAKQEIAKYPENNHYDPETLRINDHLSTPELSDYLNASYQATLGTTCPFTRSAYAHEGYDDDAAVITPELREALKKEYGEVSVFDSTECDEKTIADLTEADDGDWIVIIDYHQ